MERLTHLSAPWTDSRPHPRIANQLAEGKYLFCTRVNSLITNNSFFIVKRATAQSKTGNFRSYGAAEDPPNFRRLPQEQTSLG
jgi:hypothetical protein